MKRAILFILMLLFLGCSEPISSGRVVKKRHEPANTFIMMMPISTGKATIMVPIPIYDDEDFVVTIIGNTEAGDMDTRDLYLSEEQYNNIQIQSKIDCKHGKIICISDDTHVRGERAKDGTH